MSENDHLCFEIVNLNVGGTLFSTSRQTLQWIPDSFFTSLLSGRVPVVKDASGSIFIDRDPGVFRVVLNYMRTRQVDISSVSLTALMTEAQFYNLRPLIRRLTLCEELESSSCGSLLFHGLIPIPNLPFKSGPVEGLHDLSDSSPDKATSNKNEVTVHRTTCSIQNKLKSSDMAAQMEPQRIRVVQGHGNTIVVAYAQYACVYRIKESLGWATVYHTQKMSSVIRHVAIHTKFGTQGSERVLALALADKNIHLWQLDADGDANKRGVFSLEVDVDHLFFIGNQMVVISKTGKVGIWHSVNRNWQTQELCPITSYDTAGSSLLLGCTNGCMYYIDMQKFPLRIKDNDLLVTELYRDPNEESITALSVYLTPKTNVCGNWIEIAYGTVSGAVRIIVQHPETVGHGPQLFQTYRVHTSPVIRISLNSTHLISVCSEYNHVRTWAITRFRGMISTQPGSTSLASFKVLSLDSTDEWIDKYCDLGPYGDQDADHIFVQRVVPDCSQLFIRLCSTGERICSIKSVDGSAFTSFAVNECEGSSRMGSRPRRFLFCGTKNGSVQIWDLTTALDQFYGQRSSIAGCPNVGGASALAAPPNIADPQLKSPMMYQYQQTTVAALQPQGPSPQELLSLMDNCDVSCSSNTTPSFSRATSDLNLHSNNNS